MDAATLASLATAGGTLVLAVATFSSVRSANRAARIAELSLMEGLRPVLMPSRFQDPPEKISFQEGHWIRVEGGRAVLEIGEDVIYMGIALRNVGRGIGVLHGWTFTPERLLGNAPHADPADFRRLTRDIYIAPGDQGFWQGAFRDPDEPLFGAALEAIKEPRPVTVDLLYGDHEGGQRTISRFSLQPSESGSWIAVVGRHWNLDRDDPR